MFFNRLSVSSLLTSGALAVFGSVAQAGLTSVATDATWLTTGTKPAAGWNSSASFDTSSWSAARVVAGATYIWDASSVNSGPETAWFRKTFTLSGNVTGSAPLLLNVDDDAAVYVNGTLVENDADHAAGSYGPFDIAADLHGGANLIAVEATNYGGGHDLSIAAPITTTPSTPASVPLPTSTAAGLIGLGLLVAGAAKRKLRQA